jgi:hypothetical protein
VHARNKFVQSIIFFQHKVVSDNKKLGFHWPDFSIKIGFKQTQNFLEPSVVVEELFALTKFLYSWLMKIMSPREDIWLQTYNIGLVNFFPAIFSFVSPFLFSFRPF